MTSRPKFCSNCGETLDLNQESKKCSKCGIDLQQQQIKSTDNKAIVDQLPYKSPGTAALIAFIGGIFALPGIGHIYVGKVGKGIGILISGIIIYVLLIIMAFSLQSALFLAPDESSVVGGGGVILMMFILGIVYFVLWIWQIFNARKLAKKFNESVRTTGGKEPW